MSDTLTEGTEVAPVAKRTVKAGAKAKVRKLPKLICKEKGCRKEVVRTGNRGRPPHKCAEHRGAPATAE